MFAGSGIDDREAAFRFIKRYKEAYHTNTLKQYVAGDRIVRQWIIEACKEYGITATIEGSLDLKLNLTQMADGYSGQEHSLPIMPLYKDVVEFVARTKTFYTPTILVAYGAPWTRELLVREREHRSTTPKLRKWMPWELLDSMIRRRAQWFLPEEYGHTQIAKGVADIVHAGGRAGLGSHGQLQGLGAHWETWNLAVGRPDAARNAAGRSRSSAPKRSACSRTSARSRRASWPTCSCSTQPAREHQEHELDPLRDEERRALRGRHAQHDLAAAEAAAEAVLVGHGTRRTCAGADGQSRHADRAWG